MYNKTIIGFGFCDMQNYQCLGKSYHPCLRLANNSYLDIDNFPITINLDHPIIVYYTSKNPCRVSHAMRPGLKDAVKCILRIGSAHNKGGGEL